jgi:hypothetical protein
LTHDGVPAESSKTRHRHSCPLSPPAPCKAVNTLGCSRRPRHGFTTETQRTQRRKPHATESSGCRSALIGVYQRSSAVPFLRGRSGLARPLSLVFPLCLALFISYGQLAFDGRGRRMRRPYEWSVPGPCGGRPPKPLLLPSFCSPSHLPLPSRCPLCLCGEDFFGAFR